jgi:hypothetical protein
VGGAPIDEVVQWVRACARSHETGGPLTVTLEKKRGPKSRGYEVRLERPDRVLLTEQDPNVMLAVSHAFDRFSAIPERFLRVMPSA